MVTLYKNGAAITVIPELADTYKAMGWTEEAPKAAEPKKKAASAKAEPKT